MDAHHLVPWFPAWGVRFSEPVKNVFSVVSIINEWRPSNRWMVLAYEAAASEVHLWTAWYSLRRSEASGDMVAKTPDAEFLRLISGTRQINKAFERAGIAIDDECAWIVMLPDSELGDDFGEFTIPLESYNDATELIRSKRLIIFTPLPNFDAALKLFDINLKKQINKNL